MIQHSDNFLHSKFSLVWFDIQVIFDIQNTALDDSLLADFWHSAVMSRYDTQILRGVETRLIRSVLLNWRPSRFYFWIFKGHREHSGLLKRVPWHHFIQIKSTGLLKPLKMVLFSSCDGVPSKFKKKKGQARPPVWQHRLFELNINPS